LIEKRLYPSVALHGQVAHEIGRRIVSGAVSEGEFLPRESELAEQFGVSRQAVREALKVLAAKGLVTSRRRAGTYVVPRADWNLLDPDVIAWHPPEKFSPAFLRDIIELRRLIEPAAAAFAAERGGAEQVARIAEALASMTHAEGKAFSEADAQFHTAIFEASGNELIERLSSILGPLLAASFATHHHLQFPLAPVVAVHQSVYDAIVASDPVRAREAMEQVLTQAATNVPPAAAAAD
jgi:GntR family transcriptional regulator, galactonate operon transcriptional repressor